MMNIEVANEAFCTLNDVKNCAKNPSHDGFISFAEFSLEHLPEIVRTDAILNFIKEIGNRVVRITVTKSNGQVLYGSGVVFKVGNSYSISTNDHVIGNETEVTNCYVDFFYHHPDFTGAERCNGDSLLGGSSMQDKGYFTFSPIPNSLKDLEMFDYSSLVAQITVTYNDNSVCRCLSYVFFKDRRTFMLLAIGSENACGIRNCDIRFCDVLTGITGAANYLRVDSIEDKCVRIEVDNLPDFVIESLKKSWDAPWASGCDDFIPVVIAHPHGGPKMISLGKSILVETEKDGFLKKLYHTAPTCPGSSGGLVLTLGGDAMSSLGYAANRCIHTMGERSDSFRGIPTETGNINLSVFNN